MNYYSAFFVYNKSDASVIDDFSWWKPIMSYFIENCDNFRIECTEADEEGLKSCARLGANDIAEVHIDQGMEIWTGILDDRFKYEFVNEPRDEAGRIKWYTVILKKGEKTILSSAFSGSEFSVYDISQDDLAFLAHNVMGYPFSLYTWDSASSGEEVSFSPLYGRDIELESIIKTFKRGKK